MINTVASVITIGDELLIGQTIDTNSAWIGTHLNALGIDMHRRVAVGDNKDAITRALNEELRTAHIVIVTGGLGPTADDITKPLLLEYFGGTMRVDERVLAHVRDLFTKRNRPMLERNLKQAEVPDSCTVLFNARGTAPGMWFEREGRVVVSLPGVPNEMVGIMEDEVLPRLRERFVSGAIVHNTLVTAGEGESFIAEKIADIENSLPPHIRLAYLPGAGTVKLRLTGRGDSVSLLQEEITPYRNAMAERLGTIVVAHTDVPLERVLYDLFTARGITMAMAESCTGGLIAHLITQVPGASGILQGGVVCYSDYSKSELLGVSRETLDAHGTVSEAVAREMAAGAQRLLKADYALAVTGLLGPASASDTLPVGTVWMAAASATGVVAKKFRFFYDRARNKEMAAAMAMLLLYRFVQGYPVE